MCCCQWPAYVSTSSRNNSPRPQRVRQLVLHVCHSRGAIIADAHLANAHLVRGRAFRQAGQQKLPPLVAQYAVITDTKPSDMSMAKQLNHVPFLKRGDVSSGSCGTKVEVQDEQAALFGIYRSPHEFFLASLEAWHPLEFAFPLPDILMRNVARVLNDGPQLTVARRRLQIKKIQRRRLQLQAQEQELHNSLHHEVGLVLQGKNLLLWKGLMQRLFIVQ